MGRALAGVPHRVVPPIAPLALSGPTPGPFFFDWHFCVGQPPPGVPYLGCHTGLFPRTWPKRFWVEGVGGYVFVLQKH